MKSVDLEEKTVVSATTSSLPVHLNLNVRGLKPSSTLAINERSNLLRAQGRMVYKLGLGQSPFPVPDPVVETLRTNAFQKDYLPVKGLPALREAVAEYHRRRQGMDSSCEDVLIGPGSKELMFLLQLVYYGDLVIPTPSWVSYAPQAHIIGRHVRWLQTHRENNWRLTPDELEKLCQEDHSRPRIVILNYPSNPTGGTYNLDELEALARVAQNYGVILLSDEIYGELHHEGTHVSIAHFYPEGTIISGGMSKWCGAGGWRLGTFTFPPGLRWLLEAMANVASETFTSTSAPIQYAAVRAFRGGSQIEQYLVQSRRILRALGQLAAERMCAAGIEVHPPQGAFYLFPDFGPAAARLAERGIRTSQELCERLLQETGVAILPGSDFGRPESELTARMAYVDFDGARVLAAAEQRPLDTPLDGAFLTTFCGNVVRAVDLIGEWVRN
jgi:aspartate aminotransferase